MSRKRRQIRNLLRQAKAKDKGKDKGIVLVMASFWADEARFQRSANALSTRTYMGKDGVPVKEVLDIDGNVVLAAYGEAARELRSPGMTNQN